MKKKSQISINYSLHGAASNMQAPDVMRPGGGVVKSVHWQFSTGFTLQALAHGYVILFIKRVTETNLAAFKAVDVAN